MAQIAKYFLPPSKVKEADDVKGGHHRTKSSSRGTQDGDENVHIGAPKQVRIVRVYLPFTTGETSGDAFSVPAASPPPGAPYIQFALACSRRPGPGPGGGAGSSPRGRPKSTPTQGGRSGGDVEEGRALSLYRLKQDVFAALAAAVNVLETPSLLLDSHQKSSVLVRTLSSPPASSASFSTPQDASSSGETAPDAWSGGTQAQAVAADAAVAWAQQGTSFSTAKERNGGDGGGGSLGGSTSTETRDDGPEVRLKALVASAASCRRLPLPPRTCLLRRRSPASTLLTNDRARSASAAGSTSSGGINDGLEAEAAGPDSSLQLEEDIRRLRAGFALAPSSSSSDADGGASGVTGGAGGDKCPFSVAAAAELSLGPMCASPAPLSQRVGLVEFGPKGQGAEVALEMLRKGVEGFAFRVVPSSESFTTGAGTRDTAAAVGNSGEAKGGKETAAEEDNRLGLGLGLDASLAEGWLSRRSTNAAADTTNAAVGGPAGRTAGSGGGGGGGGLGSESAARWKRRYYAIMRVSPDGKAMLPLFSPPSSNAKGTTTTVKASAAAEGTGVASTDTAAAAGVEVEGGAGGGGLVLVYFKDSAKVKVQNALFLRRATAVRLLSEEEEKEGSEAASSGGGEASARSACFVVEMAAAAAAAAPGPADADAGEEGAKGNGGVAHVFRCSSAREAKKWVAAISEGRRLALKLDDEETAPPPSARLNDEGGSVGSDASDARKHKKAQGQAVFLENEMLCVSQVVRENPCCALDLEALLSPFDDDDDDDDDQDDDDAADSSSSSSSSSGGASISGSSLPSSENQQQPSKIQRVRGSLGGAAVQSAASAASAATAAAVTDVVSLVSSDDEEEKEEEEEEKEEGDGSSEDDDSGDDDDDDDAADALEWKAVSSLARRRSTRKGGQRRMAARSSRYGGGGGGGGGGSNGGGGGHGSGGPRVCLTLELCPAHLLPPPGIAVSISGSKLTTDAYSRQYTQYEVEVKQGRLKWTVFRRYNEFLALHSALKGAHAKHETALASAKLKLHKLKSSSSSSSSSSGVGGSGSAGEEEAAAAVQLSTTATSLATTAGEAAAAAAGEAGGAAAMRLAAAEEEVSTLWLALSSTVVDTSTSSSSGGLPKFPPKKVLMAAKRVSKNSSASSLVQSRAEALEAYMKALLLQPAAMGSVHVLSFLGLMSLTRYEEKGGGSQATPKNSQQGGVSMPPQCTEGDSEDKDDDAAAAAAGAAGDKALGADTASPPPAPPPGHPHDKHDKRRPDRPVMHVSSLGLHCSAGDLVLFKSDNSLSGLQRKVTGAEWDHVALVVPSAFDTSSSFGRLSLLESTAEGVTVYPLHSRLKAYAHGFCKYMVLRRLTGPTDNPSLPDKLRAFCFKVDGTPYGFSVGKLFQRKELNSSPEGGEGGGSTSTSTAASSSSSLFSLPSSAAAASLEGATKPNQNEEEEGGGRHRQHPHHPDALTEQGLVEVGLDDDAGGDGNGDGDNGETGKAGAAAGGGSKKTSKSKFKSLLSPTKKNKQPITGGCGGDAPVQDKGEKASSLLPTPSPRRRRLSGDTAMEFLQAAKQRQAPSQGGGDLEKQQQQQLESSPPQHPPFNEEDATAAAAAAAAGAGAGEKTGGAQHKPSSSWLSRKLTLTPKQLDLEKKKTFFCSEIVAAAQIEAGIVSRNFNVSYFWPGSFASGAEVDEAVVGGFAYGPEILLDCREMEVGQALSF